MALRTWMQDCQPFILQVSSDPSWFEASNDCTMQAAYPASPQIPEVDNFRPMGSLPGPPHDHVDADITGLRDNLGVAAARGPNEWRYSARQIKFISARNRRRAFGNLSGNVYRKTGRKNASNDDELCKSKCSIREYRSVGGSLRPCRPISMGSFIQRITWLNGIALFLS